MRIPGVNEGGNAVPRVYNGASTVPNAGIAARALGQAANTAQNIAADEIENQARLNAQQAAEDKQTQEALSRAKAANATLDHELYVKNTVSEINDGVTAGEIPYAKAKEEFDKRLTKAPQFKPDTADPVLMENYDRYTKRTAANGVFEIEKTMRNSQRAELKGSFTQSLDALQKLSGLPNTSADNIMQLNQRADALKGLGTQAGLPADVVEKTLQDFKDNNWFNHASQQVLAAGDDPIALKTLQQEITSDKGIYSDKLDATKRTSLMKSIDANLDRINNRVQHDSDKREAKAERAIQEIDKQLASTVPATPGQWNNWMETIKGTPYEQDFKDRVNDEQEVQAVLRKPIEEQLTYVQGKQTELQSKGGDLRKQANVNRLQTAVNANVKLLKENPLIFNANRTGEEVTPIDIQALATGGGDVAAQLKDRYATVAALRKRYGNTVSQNPWLPQEAENIKAVISSVDDKTKLSILGVMAEVAPDAPAYASSLKAVAADKGMLMVAGMAKFNKLKSTTGKDVAEMILQGEKIMADKSVFMPSEQEFQNVFNEIVKDGIPQGTTTRTQAYGVFKTIYASISKDQQIRHDSNNKIPDQDVARQAVALTAGEPFEYNNRNIMLPYGMPAATFESKVKVGLDAAVKSSGYPLGLLEEMPLMPAPGMKDTYFLLNGNKVQADKEGKPIMININSGEVTGTILKRDVKK